MPICTKCQKDKPDEEFYVNRRWGGLRSACIECCKIAQKATRNPRSRYGLSKAKYSEMYLSQGGRCLICQKFQTTLFVDHNHDTGAVRGLLCPKCNGGLGFFCDSRDLLLQAVRYLTEKDRELTPDEVLLSNFHGSRK